MSDGTIATHPVTYGRAEDCTLRRRIPVMVPAPGIVIDVEASFDLDWADSLGMAL